jgi:hypothetical protein
MWVLIIGVLGIGAIWDWLGPESPSEAEARAYCEARPQDCQMDDSADQGEGKGSL